MSAVTPQPMTTEQMLALPDDGTDRELIRGELREKPRVFEDRGHSRANARVGRFLSEWLDAQPEPRGEVVSGHAGFRLSQNPDTAVCIDAAYISAEMTLRTDEDAAFFEGPPVLAVEILSPSDTKGDIDEKMALYLECGVALAWLLNPWFRTVTVHRPGVEPQFFTAHEELSGEPHLPGFRVSVSELFGA